jgi:hypothetical protein
MKAHRDRGSEIVSPRENESESDRVSDATEAKDVVPTISAHISTLDEAVRISLKEATRGKSLFALGRTLKAFEITTRRRLSPEDFASALSLWWTTAPPKLRADADFDECRFELKRAFARARTPYGSNPLETAIERADTTPLPAQASRYKSHKLKRLLAVLSHLQELAGNAPFFLSTRDAAKVLGIKSPMRASDFLSGLVDDGILTVIELGKPGGNTATRYRYNALTTPPGGPQTPP